MWGVGGPEEDCVRGGRVGCAGGGGGILEGVSAVVVVISAVGGRAAARALAAAVLVVEVGDEDRDEPSREIRTVNLLISAGWAGSSKARGRGSGDWELDSRWTNKLRIMKLPTSTAAKK